MGKEVAMKKLRSRKLWVAIGGALALVLVDGLGMDLDKDTIIAVVGIVASYVLGQAYVDSKK